MRWYDPRSKPGRLLLDFKGAFLFLVPVTGWALWDHPILSRFVMTLFSGFYGMAQFVSGRQFERVEQLIELQDEELRKKLARDN